MGLGAGRLGRHGRPRADRLPRRRRLRLQRRAGRPVCRGGRLRRRRPDAADATRARARRRDVPAALAALGGPGGRHLRRGRHKGPRGPRHRHDETWSTVSRVEPADVTEGAGVGVRVRPLPPVWVMAVALLAVAANLRTAITSVPPLLDAISRDLGLSHAAAGALTTLPVLCMGVFAPVATAIAHRLGAVAAVLAAVPRHPRRHGEPVVGDDVVDPLPRDVRGRHRDRRGGHAAAPPRQDVLPTRAGRARHGALHARHDGRSGARVGRLRAVGRPPRVLAGVARSWSVLALVGALAWAPFTRARQPAPHAGRGGSRAAAVATPHGMARRRLPRPAVLVLLLRGDVAAADLCRARLVTGPRPAISARCSAGHRSSRGCSGRCSATGPPTCGGCCCRLGRARRPRLPRHLARHPLAAPWLWAVVLGSARAQRSRSALVLLVRYALTPEASGRLTGMAFLFSYSMASVGPFAMGLVRDVTGGLSLVWACSLPSAWCRASSSCGCVRTSAASPEPERCGGAGPAQPQ